MFYDIFKITINFFQFEIIIDQYLRETNIADHDEDEEKSITCDVEFNNRHDEIVPQSMDGIAEKIRNLKCVSHDIKLTLIGSQKTVSVIDGDTIDFPILRCDKCGRLYTYVPGIRENQSIKIKKKRYFNLCDSREIREEKNQKRKLGMLSDRFKGISDDFNDPLPEFGEYMQ